jgi:hypothetical protein
MFASFNTHPFEAPSPWEGVSERRLKAILKMHLTLDGEGLFTGVKHYYTCDR